MNALERHAKTLMGMIALLLAFLVAGCGSGGGDGATAAIGVQTLSQDLVPGAPGAIPPGTSPSGAASTSGTGATATDAGTTATGTTATGSTTTGTGATGTATPVDATAASSGTVVTASSPTNGATHVAIGVVGSDNVTIPRTISATFSEAMNPATIASPAQSFTVKETQSGNGVAGSVSLNADHTVATFTPDAVLASNTQFTAIVSPAASSAAGTPLDSSYAWSFTTGSQIGQAPINLQSVARFVVLGGTSISNVSTPANPTRINGQLGIDPGSSFNVTGFTDSTPPGSGIIGAGGIQVGPVVRQAKNDLLTALDEANRRTSQQVSVGTSDLATFMVNGGSPGVFPPGLYASIASLTLRSGNMTLDAQGDPDAVWVFKAASMLTVDNTRQVLLRNGAQAKNVFWSLTSSAAIGDQVSFKGNILAGTSNTIGTAAASGSTVEGRVLSASGLQLYASTLNAPAP